MGLNAKELQALRRTFAQAESMRDKNWAAARILAVRVGQLSIDPSTATQAEVKALAVLVAVELAAREAAYAVDNAERRAGT